MRNTDQTCCAAWWLSVVSTLVSLGVRLLPVVAKKVFQALATFAIGSLGGLDNKRRKGTDRWFYDPR